METIIRSYENTDFLEVREILLDAFPEVYDLMKESLISSEDLDLDKKHYIQLVAARDGKVLGYALASRSGDPILKKVNFWIDYVCVDKEARGQGIARKLMQEIERIAISEKVLFLQLTSSRFRTGARKLYMDMGFEIRESDIFRKVL